MANEQQGIYLSLQDKKQVDLDQVFDASQIQSIIYDVEDEEFYMLCNMLNGQTGFYLFKFAQDDPHNYAIITTWRNNLNIGDS